MSEKYFRKGFGLKYDVAADLVKDYHSVLVDYLKSSDYQITSGSLTVKLAKEFGFCYGVDRSVEYAYQTLQKFPEKKIYLTGEIIHNPFVNKRLADTGIKFLSGHYHKGERIEDIEPQDIVILPAFGVSVSLLNRLKERDCSVVDTTCGSVLVVWKHVERFSKEGYTALVHGKYYHEETIATVSRATAQQGGKYIIVRDIPEAQLVCDYILSSHNTQEFLNHFKKAISPNFDPSRDLVKIGVANQTTMLSKESLKVSDMIKNALIECYGQDNIDQHFRAFDTICSATQDRQDAIIDLVTTSPDLTIIIGGFNSSNTKSLTSIAQKYTPAYHIEDASQLLSEKKIEHLPVGYSQTIVSDDWLPEGNVAIALTAGASTPNAKIGEVVERLFSLKGETLNIDLEK